MADLIDKQIKAVIAAEKMLGTAKEFGDAESLAFGLRSDMQKNKKVDLKKLEKLYAAIEDALKDVSKNPELVKKLRVIEQEINAVEGLEYKVKEKSEALKKAREERLKNSEKTMDETRLDNSALPNVVNAKNVVESQRESYAALNLSGSEADRLTAERPNIADILNKMKERAKDTGAIPA